MMRNLIPLVLGAALVGCNNGETDEPTDDSDTMTDTDTDMDTDDTDDTDAAPAASVRVIHASPTAPAVSIWVDGVGAVENDLAYGEATAFASLPPGTYDIRIRAAGAVETDDVVFSVEGVAVADGDVLTAVAVGDFAGGEGNAAFEVVPLVETWDDEDTDALVRILHAGPDAPAVGIDVGNDDPSAPEVASVAFGDSTPAAGIPLPSGTSLNVGITAGGSTVTSFTLPSLAAGSQWTVIATGFLGDLPREETGFQLLAVNQDSTAAAIGQDPIVYVLHAGADAPAVDVFAGDAELVDSAAFGDHARIQVPPGTYTLDLFAHASGATRPAGNPAASQAGVTVDAGEQYLAIATGLLGGSGASDAFRVLAFAEDFDLDATQGQVGFVHASPDTPAVDIGTVTGTTLATPPVFPNTSFGNATAAVASLPANTYNLGAAAAGTTASLAEFSVGVGASTRAWAIAGGSFDGGEGPGLRLFVVDTSTEPWSFNTVLPTARGGGGLIVEN